MSATAPAADRVRHLLYLSCPALWPAWPFLPLVRRLNGREEFGLLYDARAASGPPGLPTTVYLTNLFAMPPTEAEFLALPRETYDSPSAIYAAHWRVD